MKIVRSLTIKLEPELNTKSVKQIETLEQIESENQCVIKN